MIGLLRLFGLLILLGLMTAIAEAHEVKPAYLEVTETAPGEHMIVWKQPVKEGRRLKIDPVFPAACEPQNERVSRAQGVIVLRWNTVCDLSSGTIRISGLDRTITDAYVRVTRLDGDVISAVLRPGAAQLDLTAPAGTAVIAYLRTGIEHILFGYDHLLFVLGLVLLVQKRHILKTITAFTLAHSVTLAMSALAGISLPGAPVEILIAMSIVLLAREGLVRAGSAPSLSARFPWLIAFGFGLIHGFGFAGALANIGLPEGAEIAALMLFNLGVELGQLIFVLAVLAGFWTLARLYRAGLAQVRTALSYVIGIAGTFWVIERLSASLI